tara:strand:+ start:13033 stop:13371 length:339 start_codon:yes stop_codon:yes gene_type:complete
MDYGTQISLDVIVSMAGGVIGAVGAYIKLKSKLDMAEAENISQNKEIEDIREGKKEMNISLHRRIDDQNSIISDLQKEMNHGQSKLETSMAHMELRIVKEIQNMVNEITKNK